MPSPVPWPDQASAPPEGFERLRWGMSAGEAPEPEPGSCFGARVSIALVFELDGLVLVRLTGPVQSDSLGSQGFERSDEGYWERSDDGVKTMVDVLDGVVLVELED